MGELTHRMWTQLSTGGYAHVSGKELGPEEKGYRNAPIAAAAVVQMPTGDWTGVLFSRHYLIRLSRHEPRRLRGHYPTAELARDALEQALDAIDTKAPDESELYWMPVDDWSEVPGASSFSYQRRTRCGLIVSVEPGTGDRSGLWCARRGGRYLAGDGQTHHRDCLWFATAASARDAVDIADVANCEFVYGWRYEWI